MRSRRRIRRSSSILLLLLNVAWSVFVLAPFLVTASSAAASFPARLPDSSKSQRPSNIWWTDSSTAGSSDGESTDEIESSDEEDEIERFAIAKQQKQKQPQPQTTALSKNETLQHETTLPVDQPRQATSPLLGLDSTLNGIEQDEESSSSLSETQHSDSDIQSQPLQTLQKLQQMLDDTDYITASKGRTKRDEVPTHPLPMSTPVKVTTSGPTDSKPQTTTASSHQQSTTPQSVSSSSTRTDTGKTASSTSYVTPPTEPSPATRTEAAKIRPPPPPLLKPPAIQGDQLDRLWTSKDRAKYKKQQSRLRRAQQEQRLRYSTPINHHFYSPSDDSDDTDDGLGYSLPNLPVYLSDAEEGDSEEAESDASQQTEGTPESSMSSNRAMTDYYAQSQKQHPPHPPQHPQPPQQQYLYQYGNRQSSQLSSQQQVQTLPEGYQYTNPQQTYIPPPPPEAYMQPQQPYSPYIYPAGTYPYPYAPYGQYTPPQPGYAGPYSGPWAVPNGYEPRMFAPQQLTKKTSAVPTLTDQKSSGNDIKTVTAKEASVSTKSSTVKSDVLPTPTQIPQPLYTQHPVDMSPAYFAMENPQSLAEASSHLNFDSIQKISLMLVTVALACYGGVSPRMLPLTEYNLQFYDNIRLVSLAMIGPAVTLLSVFDARENDVNAWINTFFITFTFGYALTFVTEILATTLLRLGVFCWFEKEIFSLTPQVPLPVLPWVLRDMQYRPKRITLFAADFATSCVAAPFVEELIKLKLLQWTTTLPRNFKWVNRVSTKKNKKRKRRVAEAIVRKPGEQDIVSANKFVTQMLAVSLGLKLCDAGRRILLYTKSTDDNKGFYAVCRGLFPIQELCGTMTAIALAKRDLLGVDTRTWQIILPAAVVHGMANFRGMKPIFKWNSGTPWSEMQLSPLNVADPSTLPQLLKKGYTKLMWLIILGRVLGYCVKNYYMVNRQAVKRTTTYAGKHAAFSAELATAEVLKKQKQK